MQQNQNYYQNNGQYTGSPYQMQQPIQGQQYQQPGFQQNPQGPVYNPNLSNNSNNYQYQNPMMPKEKSLIYHYIFSVYTMLTAGNCFVSLLFSGLFSFLEAPEDVGFMLLVFIPSLLVQLYNFIMGFSLLKRGRAGYLMQKISNIYTLITGGLYCLIVTPLLIIGYSDISAVSEDTQIFMAIGLILLISLIPVLIIDLCTLIYYNKRKHMFGKKKMY